MTKSDNSEEALRRALFNPLENAAYNESLRKKEVVPCGDPEFMKLAQIKPDLAKEPEPTVISEDKSSRKKSPLSRLLTTIKK